MPKSPNMKSQCIGLLIDSEKDERCVGKSRDAWFLRRQANNMAWSFNIFPPWDDHVVPAPGDHGSVARANRLHMISSNEFYCKEFGVTVVNGQNPVPDGLANQRRNSRVTRLLHVRESC